MIAPPLAIESRVKQKLPSRTGKTWHIASNIPSLTVAPIDSHADDDGVVDKKERKSIDDAHKRQLEARGRGPAQFKAYRQAKWMKNVRSCFVTSMSWQPTYLFPFAGLENAIDAKAHKIERT